MGAAPSGCWLECTAARRAARGPSSSAQRCWVAATLLTPTALEEELAMRVKHVPSSSSLGDDEEQRAYDAMMARFREPREGGHRMSSSAHGSHSPHDGKARR